MQWLHERRGETVIRLIPERRILVYVAAMMGGVAFTMNFGQRLASPVPVVVTTIGLGVAIWLGRRLAARWSHGWQGAGVGMVWFLAGCLSCLFQMSQMPAGLVDASSQARVTGVVEHVDGREDRRLRLWLRVGAVKDAPPDIAARITGGVVRLSVRPDRMRPRAGTRVMLVARIYPPPGRVLSGVPDHSFRARARDVVASGYVIRVLAESRDAASSSWATGLAAFRQARADRIASSMTTPAGGIAAALLIGDRRYVSEDTYDLFRGSGLAHLLAISGLHMGLLCFGLIGCLRGLAALVPSLACRLPVHKFAAVAGVLAGLGYVFLSGLSVSAIRAFLMAALILAAWLLDRLGLTLRNVGLAAGAILLVSPFSLLSAGFQLSFAATAALVIWFESWRGRPSLGGRFRRWGVDLVTASLVASLATLPLTAYHFGAIAPWGVMANLVGIPLTGLWIMPAGLAVLITDFLPVPPPVARAALLAMQTGIDVLVTVAGWFATLPASPLRVVPPPPAVLVIGYAGLGLVLCVAGPARTKVAAVSCILASLAIALVLRTPVDGVIFARDRGGHLLLPGEAGDAAGFSPPDGRRLSDFLADNAARILAQPVDTSREASALRLFDHVNGDSVAVVTGRSALSAGCGSSARFVLTTVRADYPCRDGRPLYSLAGLPSGNYLLYFRGADIRALRSDGQYFLISPVSRP